MKSAVPNQEDDLTKLLKQYNYQVPSDPAKAGKVSQIQEFVVPLGANVKGEEIIMKALGLEKMNGGNKTNSN